MLNRLMLTTVVVLVTLGGVAAEENGAGWAQTSSTLTDLSNGFIQNCTEGEQKEASVYFAARVSTYVADHNATEEDAWAAIFEAWVYENYKKVLKGEAKRKALVEMCIGFNEFSKRIKTPSQLFMSMLTMDVIKLLATRLDSTLAQR